MIKIAYIINTIVSPAGGTEQQLLLLLSKLDRSRFSPVLCVLHSSEWLEKEFNLCPLHVLGIESYKYPVSFYRYWQFVRYLKREKFDIVHSLFKDGMIIGITAGRLASVKKIIAVRRNQGYWMSHFDLKVTKFLNRWVDLIIANSNSTREWAANVEGFPITRIEVIHNGIDLEPFSQISEDTRSKYRTQLVIPSDAPVIGIVANLRPVKAIDMFIRAAQQVKVTIPTAHFVIVGDGELEEKLKRLVEKLGIANCVHFLGRRWDVLQILSTFDIGVLTSSSESFSNSVVEYLAAGLPVVCTEVGGAREAVEDGVNGFVVPVGAHNEMADKLKFILLGGLTEAFGAKSIKKSQDYFSLSGMKSKYEKMYYNKSGLT